MRKVFLYLLLLSPLVANAQTWQWERTISHSYILASNIVVDKFGNSYFMTNDSGNFVDSKNNITIKIGDPSLIKISPNGTFIWKAPIHSLASASFIASFPYQGAINIGPNGNIIVCANLPGALEFGKIDLPADVNHPIPNNFQTNLPWTQIFLAVCDSSGIWQQASILGAITTADYITSIATDKNSNIDVAISYTDSLTIGSLSYRADPYKLWYSTFVGNFKMNGQLNWGNNFMGLQIPTQASIIIYSELNHFVYDPDNNLYFVLEDTLLSESVFKIKPDGSFLLAKRLPAIVSDFKLDNQGNIYTVGTIEDTVDFGNGVVLKGNAKGNGFLVKYDSSFKTLSGSALSGTAGNSLLRISLDNSGNLYTMGSFSGQLRMGDSVYTNPNNYYAKSFFIAEYSANDQISMKTVIPSYAYNELLTDLILDSSGDFIADWVISEDFIGPAFVGLGCDTFSNQSTRIINVIAKLDPRPLTILKKPFCTGPPGPAFRTGDSLSCTDTALYHNLVWKFRDGKVLAGDKVAYHGISGPYYRFTVYANNEVGCQVFMSDSFKIPPPPVVAFSTQDSVACEYTKLILKDISKTDTLAPGKWPQDHWDFGDGTSSNSTKTATKIYKDTTGNFVIKLSYNNGFCAADTSMNLTVIPAPKPGFSVSDSAGCPPLTVNVSNAATKLVVSYYYDMGNGTHDTVASPTASYPNSGNYKILQQLTGSTGCVTEDSATIHVRPVFNSTDQTGIGLATIDTNSYAELNWTTRAGTSEYNLYRYTGNDTSTSTLTVQTPKPHYTDKNIDANAHSYTYYLTDEDSCGNITGRGSIGRTIRLTGSLDGDLNPKLVWNPYSYWPRGVKTYKVYRKNPDSPNGSLRDSFRLMDSLADTTFTDFGFLQDAVYNECYKVTALAKDTALVSTSNVFCFGQVPQIFVPNIFTPNGDTLNDVFIPIFSGIKQWSMVIYNRWGEKVYASPGASPRPSPKGEGESGWDGSFKGSPAPQGTYVYIIKATDYNGNDLTKKGTVILGR